MRINKVKKLLFEALKKSDNGLFYAVSILNRNNITRVSNIPLRYYVDGTGVTFSSIAAPEDFNPESDVIAPVSSVRIDYINIKWVRVSRDFIKITVEHPEFKEFKFFREPKQEKGN